MKFGIQLSYDELDTYQEVLDASDLLIEVNDFAFPQNYGLEGEKIVEKWKESSYRSRIVGIHGAFSDLILHSIDPQIATITLKRYLWNLGIADQLGAKYTVFHTNYQPEFRDRSYLQHWLDSHRRLVQRFGSKYQTTIALENYRDPSPQLLMTLDKYISSYQMMQCLDLYYAHQYSSVSIVQWLNRLKPDILHLRDISTQAECTLGQGTIDWENLLPILQGLKSDTIMIIELSNYQSVIDSLDFLNQLGLFQC